MFFLLVMYGKKLFRLATNFYRSAEFFFFRLQLTNTNYRQRKMVRVLTNDVPCCQLRSVVLVLCIFFFLLPLVCFVLSADNFVLSCCRLRVVLRACCCVLCVLVACVCLVFVLFVLRLSCVCLAFLLRFFCVYLCVRASFNTAVEKEEGKEEGALAFAPSVVVFCFYVSLLFHTTTVPSTPSPSKH